MSSSTFRYQPALDGLRAVSVVLVLLFHTGVPWMQGGYLGVSVFFTLSGYLITSLLLIEHRTTGAVSATAFYARRVRRLLPASLLCVVLVVVARWFGAFDGVVGLRADVIGAVLQVFNWVQLAGGTSYSDLFAGATSPLEHYWSLAIEEQFYWVWPLAFLGLVRWLGRERITAAVVAVTVAMSVVAVAIAQLLGPDAAYWATPARLPEILVGASLACAIRWPRRSGSRAERRGGERGGPVPTWLGAWAPVAVALVIGAAVVFPSASGPAYEGLLPLFAVLTASLIAALQVPGLAARVLASRPLVAIGKVSYGLYLFHWPVFVVLRERGWDLAEPTSMAVAFAVTAAITVGSYVLVERPIRSSSWPPAPTLRLAAVVSVAALVGAVLVAPASGGIRADEELLAAASIAPVGDSLEPLVRPGSSTASVASSVDPVPSTGTASPEPVTTEPAPVTQPAATTAATVTTPTTIVPLSVALGPAPARPVRVLAAGDSTLLYTAQGLASWATAHPQHAQVSVQWCQGCTFMLEPEIVTFPIEGLLENSRRVIGEELPAAISRLRPDVVLLMATVNEVADRRWSVEEGSLDPFDPVFRQRMRDAYFDLTMKVLAAGAPKVVWVIPPTPVNEWKEPAMNETGRFAVQHGVIREVVSTFAADVSVVDLDAWLTAAGHADDPSWRADGVHLSDRGAEMLAEQFLGPSLLTAALSG